MFNINLTRITFGLFATIIVVMSSLINSVEKYLPEYLVRSFKYGKFALKSNVQSKLNIIEVPKAWFKHFYVFSSVMISFAMYFSVKTYFMNENVPDWIKGLLDVVAGSNRMATSSAFSTFLALFLLMLQCYRRFYDTQLVSVFSSKGRMNLSHYLVGHIHYFGAIVAILSEAPNFQATAQNQVFRISDISLSDIIASILFLWAWWHQFVITKILADLRKDKKGKTVTEKHFLPHGDWFEYVSSPHSLAEMLMYTALLIVLKNNITWWYVFTWVAVNQIESSLLSHWWYKETFKNYPKQRKAVFPFVL